MNQKTRRKPMLSKEELKRDVKKEAQRKKAIMSDYLSEETTKMIVRVSSIAGAFTVVLFLSPLLIKAFTRNVEAFKNLKEAIKK